MVTGGIFAGGKTEGEGGQTTAKKFTFTHVFQTNHPVHVALLESNEMLKQKTDGRLELTIYPNSTYANYQDGVNGVRMGSIDMCPLDSAVDWLPSSGVILGPYVFRSYAHWNNFKNSDVYKQYKTDVSKAVGVKQLDLYNFGFRNLTGNKIFRTVEDFAKIKLRLVNFSPYEELAVIFNAVGTSLPIGDVYMGLQSGVVDAEENPLTQIVTMKFYEVQKYLMMSKHMLAVAGTIMSEKAWTSLSPQDQAVIEEVFRFEADRIDKLVQENENKLIAEVKSYGMTVIEDFDTSPFTARVPLVMQKHPEWADLYNKIQAIKD
jgi:tripartite ATP-independent transporter DctP family solute receptor